MQNRCGSSLLSDDYWRYMRYMPSTTQLNAVS